MHSTQKKMIYSGELGLVLHLCHPILTHIFESREGMASIIISVAKVGKENYMETSRITLKKENENQKSQVD